MTDQRRNEPRYEEQSPGLSENPGDALAHGSYHAQTHGMLLDAAGVGQWAIDPQLEDEMRFRAKQTSRWAYLFLMVAFLGFLLMVGAASWWGLALFVPGLTGAVYNSGRAVVALHRMESTIGIRG